MMMSNKYFTLWLIQRLVYFFVKYVLSLPLDQQVCYTLVDPKTILFLCKICAVTSSGSTSLVMLTDKH